MTDFSAANAAFHGFGIVRRDPLTLLGVTLLSTAFFAWAAMSFLPAYADLLDIALGEAPQDAEVIAAMLQFYSRIGLLMLFSIVLAAVMMGALYRANVFDRSQGWILGLKLGLDELRVLLVSIVVGIVASAPLLAGYIVALIVGAGVAAGGGGEGPAILLAVLLGLILALVGGCVSLWIGVRLTPAAAATIGERRFVIFEAWGMTKGRFWSIFGAYFLLYVVVFVAYTAFSIIVLTALGVSMAAGFDPETLAQTGGVDPELIESLRNVAFGPLLVIGSFIYALLTTIFYSAWYGISAVAYRTLGKRGASGAGAPAQA